VAFVSTYHRIKMAKAVLCGIALSFGFGMAGPAAAATDNQTQVVAQLHLMSVLCLGEDDVIGSDEPYLTINGQRVWSAQNVDGGDHELVNLRFDFDESVTVVLWEDDGGLAGGDDVLLRLTISASQAGTGIQEAATSPLGAGSYRLYYEVV
jgi:hypothetical protein